MQSVWAFCKACTGCNWLIDEVHYHAWAVPEALFAYVFFATDDICAVCYDRFETVFDSVYVSMNS